MIHRENISSVYNEYMDSMYAYALHLGFDKDTTMDAIHDVFYKLYTNNASLEHVSNLKFYLFRSLKNRLIDIQRSNKEFAGVFPSNSEIYENIPFQLNVSVEDEMILMEDIEEIRQKVEKVLSNLTDRQREIVYLRYIHECKYEEIAELMQISISACRNLLSKSLGKLKASSVSIANFILVINLLNQAN